MTDKITKKDMYFAIINYADGKGFTFDTEDGTMTVSNEDLKAFAKNEIARLDRRAAKAKETAAKKKAEGDTLMNEVKAQLTDEYEAIADIAARVDDPDATVAKVTYRLNQLVKAGAAEKAPIKVPGSEGKKSRTIQGYRLPSAMQANKKQALCLFFIIKISCFSLKNMILYNREGSKKKI